MLDVVGAATITAAFVLVMTAGIEAEASERAFDAVAAALVVVAGGALALHRAAPMAMLVATTAAMTVYSLREYPGGPVYLTTIAAILALSVAVGPAKAWLPAAVSTALLITTGIRDSTLVIHALYISWTAGAVMLGGFIRSRRVERDALEERTLQEERVRIARDLHDSVAHNLASISVQAGVGAHVLDQHPEQAREALLAIKRASGAALAELRATLGMLRSGEAAPREPAPGLERVDSLVEGSRSAGLPVEVVIDGSPRPLPPAVDGAAFRIIQESLTNVLRHAGPARAVVTIRHRDEGVEVEVVDDGRGPAPNGAQRPGHGLAGMRERVSLLGGEFHAGPAAAGGFRVRAKLPA